MRFDIMTATHKTTGVRFRMYGRKQPDRDLPCQMAVRSLLSPSLTAATSHDRGPCLEGLCRLQRSHGRPLAYGPGPSPLVSLPTSPQSQLSRLELSLGDG